MRNPTGSSSRRVSLLGLLIAMTRLTACAAEGEPTTTRTADRGDAARVDDARVTADRADGGGELCGNGRDDDGDEQIDEGCSCAPGATQSCVVRGVCAAGIQRCEGGDEFATWGPCVTAEDRPGGTALGCADAGTDREVSGRDAGSPPDTGVVTCPLLEPVEAGTGISVTMCPPGSTRAILFDGTFHPSIDHNATATILPGTAPRFLYGCVPGSCAPGETAVADVQGAGQARCEVLSLVCLPTPVCQPGEEADLTGQVGTNLITSVMPSEPPRLECVPCPTVIEYTKCAPAYYRRLCAPDTLPTCAAGEMPTFIEPRRSWECRTREACSIIDQVQTLGGREVCVPCLVGF